MNRIQTKNDRKNILKSQIQIPDVKIIPASEFKNLPVVAKQEPHKKLYSADTYMTILCVRYNDLRKRFNIPFRGDNRPVSEEQKKALYDSGIYWKTVKDREHAEILIEFSKQRKAKDMAAIWKVEKLILRHGFDERVIGWSNEFADEALRMLHEQRVGNLRWDNDMDKAEQEVIHRLKVKHGLQEKPRKLLFNRFLH